MCNMEKNIEIELDILPFLNYVLQKNKIEIVQSIVIHNGKDESLKNLILKITSYPEIILPYERNIDYIPANSNFEFKDIQLKANLNHLGNITEKEEANIGISLLQDNEIICSVTKTISALAFDEWHGSVYFPELLASFVTPNAPIISTIVKRASDFLGKWTGDPSLDAYQSNDPERVFKQAASVYAAIQEQNITYAVPPASFEMIGQRIRLCDMVISQKLGTCLDLSLLYASCLEQMGLNPILIIIEGHIFAGVWLENCTLQDSVIDDVSQISKRLASGINEIAIVECTAFCSAKNYSFDKACEVAEIELLNIGNVNCIIDIKRARMSGITPIPARVKNESSYSFIEDESAQFVTASPKREISQIDVEMYGDKKEIGKKEIWERKLLDLGLRNKLISLSYKSVLPIFIDNIDKIEDYLADGKDLSILPRPQEWYLAVKDLGFETMHCLGPNSQLIYSELENKRLRSALNEGELDSKLKDLYRKSKLSIEENGANTLYIALGLLKWYESDRSVKPRYAPLILVPIELVRKGGKQGYVIRMRDEETQMNITILEKLKKDFKIDISGLEHLPTDEFGVDTRKVFTIIRKNIMNQPKWDVLESAYIGIFSFSQFVMWNDINKRTEDLLKNKIVRSLMEGKLAWNPEPMDFENYSPSSDLYFPISVDGSQMYAIDSAAKGKSFILHGPPGTGKSQTITVMIANALAQGKSVLFVAEKMAALEVVQKRLENIGLGPFCLELHSNKAKKKDVLEQFRIASEVVKGSCKEEYERKLKSINEIKEPLDNYAFELHKVRKTGFSFFEIINQYENYQSYKDIYLEGMLDANKIDRIQFEKMERMVNRLITAGKIIGHPQNHPLSLVGLKEYSQTLKEEVDRVIIKYLDSLKGMQFSLMEFEMENKMNVPSSYSEICAFIEVCKQLERWYQYPLIWALQDNVILFVEIETMANHFINFKQNEYKLLSVWKKEFLNLSANDLLSDYNNVTAKWALPRSIGINRIAKSLALYSKVEVDKKRIGEMLLLLKQYQDEKTEAYRLLNQYGNYLGGLYQGEMTDWNLVSSKAVSARNNFKELNKVCSNKEYINYIYSNSKNYELISNVVKQFNELLNFKTIFEKLLFINNCEATTNWIDSQYKLCGNIINNKDELKNWVNWKCVEDEAIQNGLKGVVLAYYNGEAHEELLGSYYKAIYKYLALEIIKESASLNKFSGPMFDEQIKQFEKLDDEIRELSKKAIYYSLASRVPDFGREASKSSEVGILQKAIKSNGRGISIRTLMDQIPTLLHRLCPCMLMSPISAAQYLDPNRESFDIVIFDEASQLPTSKAVGVLARGKEAVIVGDPKQMPPTSFFASNTFDEENVDVEDLESVLDDCLALNVPETHLKWHYRSRHESLISFSNINFYDNKLYTFPSVNDRESKVTLTYVGGKFDRGGTRTNRKEAEMIVEEIKRRYNDEELNKYSVGIVTFNSNQQNLIDDLLMDECNNDPKLDAWVNNEKEPLFVKNIENVQGDERDVILFSVAFAADESGRVSMNFGPLNREGGWRRLNVAVSRARFEMKVFTSLMPEQINLSRTKAEGVAALKSFLEYASGKTALLNEHSIKGRKFDVDGIIKSIKQCLEDNGYETDVLVGRSEFKIDIGVIDPSDKDNYLLGIILDGDSYHAAKTTRDREIAQIDVLKDLGWSIHRVWTMDWCDNKERELNNILVLLEKLKNSNEKKAGLGALEEKKNNIEIVHDVQEENTVHNNKSFEKYKATNLYMLHTSAENMLDKFRDEIIERMHLVVENEAPICEALLYKRVAQSFGVTKIGSRIQNEFDLFAMHCGFNITKQMSGKVYWSRNYNPNNYHGFRESGLDDDKREVKDVPIIEALNAICYILFNDISVEEQDLIKEAAKLLGYSRLGSGATVLFDEALVLGEQMQKIIKNDVRWMLTETGNQYAEDVINELSNKKDQLVDDRINIAQPLVASSTSRHGVYKKCVYDKILKESIRF